MVHNRLRRNHLRFGVDHAMFPMNRAGAERRAVKKCEENQEPNGEVDSL
jgi:hypothetical protein